MTTATRRARHCAVVITLVSAAASGGAMLAAAPAHATPQFTIRGQIRDASGNPLALSDGDTATLSDNANFAVPLASDGTFVLPANPAGPTQVSFDSYRSSGLAAAALPRLKFTTNAFNLSGDLALDFRLPTSVITTHLTDRHGEPVQGRYTFISPNPSTFAPINIATGISAIPTQVYGPTFWDTHTTAYTDATGTAKARIYSSGSVYERIDPGLNTTQSAYTKTTDLNGIDARTDTDVDIVLDTPINDEVLVDDVSTTEGNSGSTQMIFYAELEKPLDRPVSVGYSTRDISATAGTDYLSTSGTVTIATGSTYTPIPVTVFGDTSREPTESVALDLYAVTGSAVYTSTATGTIQDDDGSGMNEAVASIEPSTDWTTPQVAPTASTLYRPFSIVCSKPGTRMRWHTTDGTAEAGVDYLAAAGSYTCGDNQSELAVTLLPASAPSTPPIKYLGVQLDDVDPGVRVTNAATRLYLQDPAAIGYPIVSAKDASVAAGASAVAVALRLSRPVTESDVLVNYSTRDLSAVGGVDYTPSSGSVVFTPGQTLQVVSIPLSPTNRPAKKLRFAVTLSTTSAFTSTDHGATVTISPVVALTSLTPSAVAVGARNIRVTLIGGGIAPGAIVTVSGGGVTATPVETDTATLLTVRSGTAASLTTRNVRVTNPDGSTALCRACLRVNPAPTATSLSARTVAGGANVGGLTLTGSGFQAGAQAVAVGAGPAVKLTNTMVAATSITLAARATNTARVGTYDVKVTNPDGGSAVCHACLDVVAAPTIATVDPSTLVRGQTYSLSVAGTGFFPGATVKGPPGFTVTNVRVIDPSTVVVAGSVSPTARTGTGLILYVVNAAAAGGGKASFPAIAIA